MAKIDVTLINNSDGQAWPAEVILDQPVGDWVAQLLKALDLPRVEDGCSVDYRFIIERTGDIISENECLASYDIQAGETLRLARDPKSEKRPKSTPARPKRKSPLKLILLVAAALLVVMVVGWGVFTFLQSDKEPLPAAWFASASETPTALPSVTPSPEETPTLTATLLPTETATATMTLTPTTTTPTLDSAPSNGNLGETWTRPKDNAEMVFVPKGEFLMGSAELQIVEWSNVCASHDNHMGRISECRYEFYDNEEPATDLQLMGFWMDKFEVTNAQFSAFLNETENQEEGGALWLAINEDYCLIEKTGNEFNPKEGYANHPVIGVTWYGAKAYAEWVGGRLPTEAEWEYAASGPNNWYYPWGFEFYCSLGNFDDQTKDDSYPRVILGGEECDGYVETAPVGSFPAGASWCGVENLSGNVAEWTQSLYLPYPYDPEDGREDLQIIDQRVVRGGDWQEYAHYLSPRCDYRGWGEMSTSYNVIGFRVVIPIGDSVN